jgi:hypothetical protein
MKEIINLLKNENRGCKSAAANRPWLQIGGCKSAAASRRLQIGGCK